MKQQFKDVYRHIHDMYVWFNSQLETLEREGMDEVEISEMTDQAYCYHRLEQMFDELRKTAKKKKLRASGKAAEQYCKNAIDCPFDAKDKIKTEYCTATPKTDSYCPYPTRKDDPCYATVMQYLGIPSWTWTSFDNEMLRLHYPGLKDYTNWLVSSGNSLPPGFDPNRLETSFVMSFRKRKDILS